MSKGKRFIITALLSIPALLLALTSCSESDNNPILSLPSELTESDGKLFDNKSLEGKPLVINLFASWCDPCKREISEIEKIHNRSYKPALASKYLDDLFKFMESSVNKYFILIDKNINIRVKCLEFNKVINVEPNDFDKKIYKIFEPTSYYWETKKAATMLFYEENMKVHFPISVVDLDSFFFLENVETRKIFSSESYNPKTINCIG